MRKVYLIENNKGMQRMKNVSDERLKENAIVVDMDIAVIPCVNSMNQMEVLLVDLRDRVEMVLYSVDISENPGFVEVTFSGEYGRLHKSDGGAVLDKHKDKIIWTLRDLHKQIVRKDYDTRYKKRLFDVKIYTIDNNSDMEKLRQLSNEEVEKNAIMIKNNFAFLACVNSLSTILVAGINLKNRNSIEIYSVHYYERPNFVLRMFKHEKLSDSYCSIKAMGDNELKLLKILKDLQEYTIEKTTKKLVSREEYRIHEERLKISKQIVGEQPVYILDGCGSLNKLYHMDMNELKDDSIFEVDKIVFIPCKSNGRLGLLAVDINDMNNRAICYLYDVPNKSENSFYDKGLYLFNSSFNYDRKLQVQMILSKDNKYLVSKLCELQDIMDGKQKDDTDTKYCPLSFKNPNAKSDLCTTNKCAWWDNAIEACKVYALLEQMVQREYKDA